MTLPPLPGGCIGMFHCLDDDGNEVEMAFWYVRAQRRALT
jgi:hypothetical protein